MVVRSTTKVLRISPPHCSGESDEIIDDHWIHAKRKLKRTRIDINFREAVGILVDSFAEKLGSWASDNDKLINELNTVSALGAFIKHDYTITEDLVEAECFHLHSLIKLDQENGSLLEYTHAFNYSYGYLNNEISHKAASIWYIKGLKSPSLSAKLWSNWTNGKYTTLIALQGDASEISLK